MLKLVFASWVVTICLIISSAEMLHALCPENITAYWKLDEANPSASGYKDTVTNAYNAVCSTCPSNTPDGMIGDAQFFDGLANGIQVPATPTSRWNWTSFDNFSIEFWIKAEAFAGESVVIGRKDPGTGLDWRVGINGNGEAAASLVAVNGSGAAAAVSGSTDLRDNAWHHVAFVRDADFSENRLYVDGKLVDTASTVYTDGFNSAAAEITIGWLNSGSGFYFAGAIDEMALYSDVLVDAVISQHAQDGFIGLRWGYCSDETPVKIMPLGDSITRGTNGTPQDPVGFRLPLFRGLENKASPDKIYNDYNVAFVGSLINGNEYTDFDPWHEGHSGALADETASSVSTYLSSNPPDIVLLHIGTNDISAGDEVSQIVGEIETILNEIDQFDPAIPVVLAQIINRKEGSALIQRTSDLNIALMQMAENRIHDSDSDRILIVNQESALSYPYDLVDTVHPNTTGYQKMADTWYDGLVSFLPPTHIAPPLVTSSPVTRANLGAPYVYQLRAQGNPAPQFTLLDPSPLPDDMAIDPVNGKITWTPTTDNTVSVGVEAANPHGSDFQTFDIIVGKNPVALNDTYGAITQGSTLEVTPSGGVLVNDDDDDGDPLEALLVTSPSNGALTFYSDGSFTYAHDGSNTTSDSFSYQAFDGAGYSNIAGVAITVNLRPVAVNDAYGPITENGKLEVDALQGVLQNDTDAEYDPLSAVLVSNVSNGTLLLNGDGSFSYEHNGGASIGDAFSYIVFDGFGYSDEALVSIVVRVNMAPVITGQGNLEILKNEALTISLLNLIVNDPDNDYPQDFTLTLYEGANYTLDENTVTPSGGITGTLTVPVSVNDGSNDSNIFDLKVVIKDTTKDSGSNACFIRLVEMDDELGSNTFLGKASIGLKLLSGLILLMGACVLLKKQ